MIDFNFTFPLDKTDYLEDFDRLSRRNRRFTECIKTNDGWIYCFEFYTQNERMEYEQAVSNQFPNLFID